LTPDSDFPVPRAGSDLRRIALTGSAMEKVDPVPGP
jgi:hypothetical protein